MRAAVSRESAYAPLLLQIWSNSSSNNSGGCAPDILYLKARTAYTHTETQ